MPREIEWSTTIQTPLLAEKVQKMILQMKIAKEMREYEDEMKWEQYRNFQIIKDLEYRSMIN